MFLQAHCFVVATSRPHWRNVRIEILILTDPEPEPEPEPLILISYQKNPDTAERDLSEGTLTQSEPSQEQSVFGDFWRFSKSYPL